jgi:superfamily II DNA/RNA helicase
MHNLLVVLEIKRMNDDDEKSLLQKDYVESTSFDALPLKRWLKEQCRLLGFDNPTPVQHACVPRILEGTHKI